MKQYTGPRTRANPFPFNTFFNPSDNPLTMKLTASHSDMKTSGPIVVLNEEDCLTMGVDHTDRVRITGRGSAVSTVVITDFAGVKGRIVMSQAMMKRCRIKEGEEVEVAYSPMPESIRSIRKKINGGTLGREEIESIVDDIMDENLSDKEILAFISAFNVKNADIAEVAFLTRAMAATGKTVDLGVKPVFDFHSLGGVPGNKITPIVVSIVASEGLYIPKMSSRAISSACGTSDFVDTFCDVEMDTDALVSAVREAGGVFACGNEDYAPVGSLIIAAERPMGIDPRPMMMASIMSKKVAVGTTHLLIDIPLGRTTKTPDMQSARDYAEAVRNLGTLLGVHIECAVTKADQPLGRAIGPLLEAKECIEVLEGKDCDPDVVEKACSMAGILLEMAGEEDGKARALQVLKSGKAHGKFLQIVKTQNGNPALKSEDIRVGKFFKDVHAKKSGYLGSIDNHSIVAIAKAAGAPSDLEGGLELFRKVGDKVREGDVLFRIYAKTQSKLDRAVASARSRRPMEVVPGEPERIGDVIVETIPSKEMLALIRFRN